MDNIQLNLASRVNRFLAYLIDILIITFVVFLFAYFFFGFDITISNYLNSGDDIQSRIDFLKERNNIRDISFLIWVIYCIFSESSVKQGTLGKNIMGIKVVDMNGDRLSFNKSLIRNISKILSLVVIALGFIWILFDKYNRGWHDLLAKTYVMNKDYNYMAKVETINEPTT